MLKMIKSVLAKKSSKPASVIPSVVASKNTKGPAGGSIFEMAVWARR